jgi:hypothetical protein
VEERGLDALAAELDALLQLAESGDDTAVRRRLFTLVNALPADDESNVPVATAFDVSAAAG